MDYSKLTNAELDEFLATQVMGWHRGYSGNWSWGEYNGTTFMDFSGPSIASWHPSRGETLNRASNEVLLKVLGDGYTVNVSLCDGQYQGEVWKDGEEEDYELASAPTLPRALCEAIAAAFEVKK